MCRLIVPGRGALTLAPQALRGLNEEHFVMVKARGQKASEAPTNINEALGELRGLVRERPPSLYAIANLVWQWDQGDVMLDYALDALTADKHEAFRLQLKLAPDLYYGEPIKIPQPLPPIWRELELTGINLEGVDLGRFDLSGLKMVSANLKLANLQYADLLNASLEGASLEGADLSLTNLEAASLKGANLEGANLEGAYLVWANLEGANLTDAELRGADDDAATIWPEGFDMSRL